MRAKRITDAWAEQEVVREIMVFLHTEEELGPLAANVLEVPDELIRAALDLELADGAVVADSVVDTPCFFLGGLCRGERTIAVRLLGIAAGKTPRARSTRARPCPGSSAGPGSPRRRTRPVPSGRRSPRRSR